MISFGKGYVNAVFGSRKQSVVYGQQDIKGLRGPGKEKVTSDGNLFDIHLPANIQGLLPVGLECWNVVFGNMYVIQQ